MSKKKLSGRALAVQLGREEIRIARLTLGAAMPQLQNGKTVPTPPGAVEDGFILDPEPLKEAFKAALADPEYKRYRNVVFCLCSTLVISDTARIPPQKGRKLEKLLEANADMYFPMADQGSRLTWTSIGTETGADGQETLAVQMWETPVGLLSRYYELANQCGLSVLAIDYCGNSMASILDAGFAQPAGSRKRKQVTGAKGTARSGGSKKPRKRNGEDDFSAATATAVMEPPEEDAAQPGGTKLYLLAEEEHLLLTFVRDGQVELQRLLLRGADGDELDEARMALEFYRGQGNNRSGDIEVLAAGPAADVWYMEQAGQALGIPVRAWSFQPGAEWCLCLGASRTQLDFGVPAMNNPKYGRREMAGRIWQYALVLSCGALLTASLLLAFGSRPLWSTTLAGMTVQKENLERQAAKNPGAAADYQEYSNLYDAYSSDWEKIFNAIQANNNGLVWVIEELEEVLPSDVQVVTIGIAPTGMGVQFACPDKETAAYVIQALRELEYAELVQVSTVNIGTLSEARYPGPKYTTGSDMLAYLTGGEAKEQTGGDSQAQTEADTDSEAEPAPTKGSYSPDKLIKLWRQAASEAGASTYEEVLAYAVEKGLISTDDLLAAMDSLSSDELAALEAAYGTPPSTSYSLDELLEEADFDERKAALETMLSDDHISQLMFLKLVKADIEGDQYLFSLILSDLLKNYNALESLLEGDLTGLRAAMSTLLDILTRDEKRLSAAEELIRSDRNLSGRYAYYLAVSMGKQEENEEAGTLDKDQLLGDLVSGSQSGNSTVTGALNTVKENVLLSGDDSKSDSSSSSNSGGENTDTDAAFDALIRLINSGALSNMQTGDTDSSSSGGENTGANAAYDALMQMMNSGASSGGQTGGAGSSAAASDEPQVYLFAVTLRYLDTLREEAAAGRNGLDRSDKVEKLEVTP